MVYPARNPMIKDTAFSIQIATLLSLFGTFGTNNDEPTFTTKVFVGSLIFRSTDTRPARNSNRKDAKVCKYVTYTTSASYCVRPYACYYHYFVDDPPPSVVSDANAK